jgi:hypothetical protein
MCRLKYVQPFKCSKSNVGEGQNNNCQNVESLKRSEGQKGNQPVKN